MPQRRKVPFSGKKKKDQLLQKRQRKGSHKLLRPGKDDSEDGSDTTEDNEVTVHKLMEQPLKGCASGSASLRNKNVNRYNLQFYQESRKELEEMKMEGYKPYKTVTPKQREIGPIYFSQYDFPQRPEWSYDMNKDTLDRNENRYFREYVEKLQQIHRKNELSLFELNLETWRQLWRVLELSDVLLIIVDVRYATLMFPPALYEYIINTLKKHAILVLNKVDLVAPEVVLAWKYYFQKTYVDLPLVLFASYQAKLMRGSARARTAYKRSMEGIYNIYRECKKIVESEVDLSRWKAKILEDMNAENIPLDDTDSADKLETVVEGEFTHPSGQSHQKMYADGILTVGCIGFPNVGKSSLINALKGRKVVSVSRTPGHTKHFQTIFLTHQVRLCDCPGLVFPSSTPKHLQVLLGSFPIAQLRAPYRSLKFMAEHLNLPQQLKLQLPEDYDDWSAIAVADAWAMKRGFLTAKAARPDRYRAANHLLRMCLAGQQQLILQFYPPGFSDEKENWQRHPEIEDILRYQNTENENEEAKDDRSHGNSESENSDGKNSSKDRATTDYSEEEDYISTGEEPQNTFALLEDD